MAAPRTWKPVSKSRFRRDVQRLRPGARARSARAKDITDKIWCPVVGVVLDTSDGKLVVSAALPKSDPASDVSSVGALRDKPLPYTPPVAKVSGDQATKIALALMPGKATSVKIERKKGKNVYVVEIQTPAGRERRLRRHRIRTDRRNRLKANWPLRGPARRGRTIAEHGEKKRRACGHAEVNVGSLSERRPP